ncbi:hypothetical protein [Mesorhizobium sp. L-8-10]|uniref:hypothetical protein n=1 Tax=Mesorhizobium sp. L-8-10 TaxID=2744523 RepID=UPI001AEFB7A0|nr:hypothetical protein [Mesorhizobium sp. L-8-10]
MSAIARATDPTMAILFKREKMLGAERNSGFNTTRVPKMTHKEALNMFGLSPLPLEGRTDELLDLLTADSCIVDQPAL